MDLNEVVFWVLAVVSVGSAAMILLSPWIVHMAFWLLASLAGFAGLYLHLGADFLGFAQVLVYIGGILILFLFGVMLTQKADVPVHKPISWRIILPGIVVGIVLQCMLVVLMVGNGWKELPPDQVGVLMGPAPLEKLVDPTSEEIGIRFMSRFILPFEVVSVLLLVAMIGATYIARSREDVKEEGSQT